MKVFKDAMVVVGAACILLMSYFAWDLMRIIDAKAKKTQAN